jgi:hypothetical protein
MILVPSGQEMTSICSHNITVFNACHEKVILSIESDSQKKAQKVVISCLVARVSKTVALHILSVAMLAQWH